MSVTITGTITDFYGWCVATARSSAGRYPKRARRAHKSIDRVTSVTDVTAPAVRSCAAVAASPAAPVIKGGIKGSPEGTAGARVLLIGARELSKVPLRYFRRK